MASTKEYLEFVLEQLLYYKKKIFGGIYDDQFLVKPVKAAVVHMPDAAYELPYEGAKEMLLVDRLDDKAFLSELVRAMYEELPAPREKKK